MGSQSEVPAWVEAHNAKLTEAQVIQHQTRLPYEKIAMMAKEFGVSSHTSFR